MATPLSWVSEYCTSEALTFTTPPSLESIDHRGLAVRRVDHVLGDLPGIAMVPDRMVLPSEATSPRRFRSVH